MFDVFRYGITQTNTDFFATREKNSMGQIVGALLIAKVCSIKIEYFEKKPVRVRPCGSGAKFKSKCLLFYHSNSRDWVKDFPFGVKKVS